MKLIISPAKKMVAKEDFIPWQDLPVFLENARVLMDYIRSLSLSQAKALWSCNESLAGLNYRRFQEMDLEHNLTPAILAYEGIQYQYMAPQVFEQPSLDYVQEHLRILSGFYGILKPLDGVTPYRLEMQARPHFSAGGREYRDLYSFWGDSLWKELTADDPVVINLASKEYSRAVEPFLGQGQTMVHVVFGGLAPDSSGVLKIKTKATEAKMARGEMVRFLAETRALHPGDLKNFRRLGYRFSEEMSDDTHYIFLKGL